jgi:hypothetical protein
VVKWDLGLIWFFGGHADSNDWYQFLPLGVRLNSEPCAG